MSAWEAARKQSSEGSGKSVVAKTMPKQASEDYLKSIGLGTAFGPFENRLSAPSFGWDPSTAGQVDFQPLAPQQSSGHGDWGGSQSNWLSDEGDSDRSDHQLLLQMEAS